MNVKNMIKIRTIIKGAKSLQLGPRQAPFVAVALAKEELRMLAATHRQLV